MALKYADRVKETTATTGDGTLTLAGAATGFQTFAAIGDGHTCIYCLEDVNGTAWEVGVGTYTASGTTLARTTVIASTNSGNKIVLTSGTHSVYVTANAKAVELAGVFGLSETSVTGTGVTATFGTMHVCSGTTSDYTLTLPAATAANAGRLVGVRMAAGLTKLVTIDGNASETIDGATTRVMWAGESAILLCDGTGWTKIAGKSKPMIALLIGTNLAQAVDSDDGVYAKIGMSGETIDNTGMMVDYTTNDRITIMRGGLYSVKWTVRFNNVTNAGAYYAAVYKGGASLANHLGFALGDPARYPIPSTVFDYEFNATDYLEGYFVQYSTSDNQQVDGQEFSVIEVNPW